MNISTILSELDIHYLKTNGFVRDENKLSGFYNKTTEKYKVVLIPITRHYSYHYGYQEFVCNYKLEFYPTFYDGFVNQKEYINSKESDNDEPLEKFINRCIF